MKKSLIALAVLAASGAAMAQSSVTLFGVVDAGVTYAKSSGQKANYGLTNSGSATSRIGFRGEQPLEDFIAGWRALPGIGDWTAHYIAMRALGQPDAFPAGDLVLRKQAGDGITLSEKTLQQRAEAWRPWRAYAARHLWHAASSSNKESSP